MKIYTPIKLNVSRLNTLKDVFAKQLDSNSRYLDCAFFDGNNKLIKVTSGNIAVNAMRSDGTYRSFAGSINENGTVRVPLTNWMLDVAGTLSCSVTVYEGDEKLTTATFVLTVQPSENPTGTVSPDDPNVDLAEQLVERCERAAEQIEAEFDGAGIDSKTYTALFNGEFSVSTVQETEYVAPHALASVTGRLPQNYLYKVTFDGAQYVVPVSLSFIAQSDMLKVFEYIGKLSLRTSDDASGLTHVDPDVPFLIVSDLDGHNSIDVFTEQAGEHTFSVERITFDGTMLPRFLMYGGQYFPIEFVVTNSTYTGISIGANKLHSTKETIAIGNGNSVRGEMSHVIGSGNVLNSAGANDVFGRNNTLASAYSLAFGSYNTISGANAHAFGTKNNILSLHGYAFGRNNDVSGVMGEALGYKNSVSGKFATAIGNGSLANHLSQYAIGSYNEADPSEAAADERGNYLEIVGNGADADHRSNARTLDWSGNESLAGSITLGKGTADEVTLSAAQLKRLIALLS